MGAAGTAGAVRTAAEAIALIETARSAGDLFGAADASRRYRRLARLTHPDATPATRGRRRRSRNWPGCGRSTSPTSGGVFWSPAATSPTCTRRRGGC